MASEGKEVTKKKNGDDKMMEAARVNKVPFTALMVVDVYSTSDGRGSEEGRKDGHI